VTVVASMIQYVFDGLVLKGNIRVEVLYLYGWGFFPTAFLPERRGYSNNLEHSIVVNNFD
jgi:hypothetical protein